MSVERFEPQVARSEIELFIIERVVRNVHLAVDARQMAVGVNHHGGVVVNARRAAFKQRTDDDDAARGRQSAERLRAWPRNRFGKIEVRMILALAEIARAEQLLGRNHVRALTRGFLDARQAFVQILARIVAAAHLNQRHVSFILVALIGFHIAIITLLAQLRPATLHFECRPRFIKSCSRTTDKEAPMKSILLASITAISIFAAVSLGAQASLPAGFRQGAQASLPAGFSLGEQAYLPVGFRLGLFYDG